MDWTEMSRQGAGFILAYGAVHALSWVVRRYVLKEDKREDALVTRVKDLEKQNASLVRDLANLHTAYASKLEALNEKRVAGERMITRGAIAQTGVTEAMGEALELMRLDRAALTTQVGGLTTQVSMLTTAVRDGGFVVPEPQAPPDPSPQAPPVAPLSPQAPSRSRGPLRGNSRTPIATTPASATSNVGGDSPSPTSTSSRSSE